MSACRTLYHLARADLLERTRRYSFLVTIGLTIYVVYLFLPPLEAPYLTFGLGDYRGVYNSAWVGSVVAVLCSALLALPAFYLVKGTVARDEDTRVGQVIATTPLSKWLYIAGKVLSNLAFLTLMMGVVALAAMGMQLLRRESAQLELWPFLSPLLCAAWPTMLLVSALAVLFEATPWLRGGLGNVVYLGLWLGALLYSVILCAGSILLERGPGNDPLGIAPIITAMTGAAREHLPGYTGGFSIGLASVSGPVQTFVWPGVQWTAGALSARLLWVGIALTLTVPAALLFRRFDPAWEPGRRREPGPEATPDGEASIPAPGPAPVSLRPLAAPEVRPAALLGQALRAELGLMLRQRPGWNAVAVALVVAGALLPLEAGRQYLLPLAWLWPVLVWSEMGSREGRYGVSGLVFSAAHPLRRHLPAIWCAGLMVAVLTGAGVAVRLLLAARLDALAAWLIGAAFIPSLALALGTWSGGHELFEVTYVLLWYAGPVSRVVPLDFVGVTDEAVRSGVSLYYLGVTLLLLVLAVIGRRRQIRAQ